MRFKEYFLLRETPDHAYFGDATKNKSISFSDTKYDPVTFMMTDRVLHRVRTEDMYHSGLFAELSNYYNLDNFSLPEDERDELSDNIFTYGIIDERLMEVFEDIQNNPKYVSKSDRLAFLHTDPQILIGRYWSLDRKGTKGFSFWNQGKVISEDHKKLLNGFIQSIGIDPSTALYDVTNRLYDAEEFAALNVTKTSDPNYVPSTAIHEFPPEKKKEALLAAGARPKVAEPIQNRKRRSGD